jgi:hypothetical protein
LTCGQNISNFYELANTVLLELLISKRDFVLIDMPELMLRMKVASMFSLDQLKEIFNDVLNRAMQEELLPEVAACLYYPEVFQKPRDEYMAAMLQEIAKDEKYRKVGDR